MDRVNCVCRLVAAVGLPLAFAGAAAGQTINDGNMNALPIGTAPDCTAPAGAWLFPETYTTAGLCEVNATDFSIVATSSFEAGATGNSLALSINDPVSNLHLTNLFTGIINEAPGLVVTVEWDIWVAAVGGGSTVYIGADMGGGGFSNVSDRGPQISWLTDGTVQYNAAGINTVIVPSYTRGAWQHVTVDIKLDTDTFNMFLGPRGGTQTQVGANLGFRSSPLDKLDRFSIAHFGAAVGLDNDQAFYDNVTISIRGGPTPCYANCDNSTIAPILNVSDFICFQTKYAAGDPYANCDGSTIPPVLNVSDFICYQTKYAAGCT